MGKKLSGDFGENFLEYIKYNFSPIGSVDLVAYFFRRIFEIIKPDKFLALIATHSIAEGSVREGGLSQIIKKGGDIHFAIKAFKWPGIANVEVSLVGIHKGKWKKFKFLNHNIVSTINSYLDDQGFIGDPMTLKSNNNQSFQGTIVLGDGFVLSKSEADKLLKVEKNSDIIKKYQNGSELNTHTRQEPGRYVINFNDWSKNKAEQYVQCFEIVESKVRPEREKIKSKKKNLNSRDKKVIENYWQYESSRKNLYKKIKEIKRHFRISTGGTKYVVFSPTSDDIVYSHTIAVITLENFSDFAILSSSIYDGWAWKYCSIKGGSTLRYAPTTAFENFPFPQPHSEERECLENVGLRYFEFRKRLMNDLNLGLTKTYNQYHNEILTENVKILNKKEFEKEYGKESWNLYNHLILKKEGKITFEESISRIVKLRDLHKEMDCLILNSYGWGDINLKHNFYQIDYLPESDNIRYTVHPDARKEILKRLLLLNHERYEEEIKLGLHKKKDVIAFYKQKNKPVPEGTVFSDVKATTKKFTIKRKLTNSGQEDLFAAITPNIMKEFSLHDGIYTIRDAAAIINKTTDRVRRWFTKLSEINYEGLDENKQQDIEQRRISFHGLIELVVIGELIEEGFSIQKIFKSRSDLATKASKVYPFATNDVNKRLKVSGSDITWEFESGNVTLNGKGQFNIELVREFFRDIEFDTSGIAQRIVPSKGLGKIEITPKRAGGKPSIISQQGVRVETILRFYDGPESVNDIISDYGISKEDISAVIAFQS